VEKIDMKGGVKIRFNQRLIVPFEFKENEGKDFGQDVKAEGRRLISMNEVDVQRDLVDF